ncbi:MAG: hypothetical protein JST26_11370 [Bacteroidetes bacterium]|nr:hypothetical protein [Bacteroidota bacterium]
MKRRISIELYEECDNVNYYTFRFLDENDNEFDKFFGKYDGDAEFERDFNIILGWLDKIGEDGADVAHFRPEGGSLKALPVNGGKLRLYCFRVSDCIVVLGNGGNKKTRTYQEDPLLNKFVSDLNEVGRSLWNRFKGKGTASIYNCKLLGNLEFEIETEKLKDDEEE